jgi:hypothetical protein
MLRKIQWPVFALKQAPVLTATDGCGKKVEGCKASVFDGESAKRNLPYHTPAGTYHPAFMLPTVLLSLRLSEKFGGSRNDLNTDTCINGQP